MLSPLSALNSQLTAKRGFALLITVTLLAFLVVLLVGLAAYTRVETAVAGNTQRQTQARQNALMALDVALGQLQKYAGPDQRVTAPADAFGGTNGTKHFTGVWHSDPTVAATPATPLTWLVSGNELQSGGLPTPLAIKPSAALTTTNAAELVGIHTSGTANDVLAPLQTVTTVGSPGVAGATATTIGRYAWWVGDQGVKASVALADPTATASNFAYAPYTSAEMLSRIRQQISLGTGPADNSGNPVFEPRDTNNAPLVANQKVTAYNQLVFLKNSGNATLGLTPLNTYFHAWSSNNFAVLANTSPSLTNLGLRQDLSLYSPAKPSPLGTAFDAWANYDPANGGYMEDPNASSAGNFPPQPQLTSDPLRRRYLMQGSSPLVSPILSLFLLSFNVRTQPTGSNSPSASPQPLQVRLRGAFTLWNPYSSALVPEANLRLDLSGLPSTVTLTHSDGTTASSMTVPFASAFQSGNSIRISLPWSVDLSNSAADSRSSWLPGRTYSWTIAEDLTSNTPSTSGYTSQINSQMDASVYGDGVIQNIAGTIVDGGDSCVLSFAGTTQITARLVAVRSGVDVPLATFTSPTFNSFTAQKTTVGAFTYTPTFVFRLAESDNGTGAWLTTPGLDPRASPLPGDAAYVVGTTGYVNGPSPDLYPNVTKVSAPDRLLDRATNSYTYNEDVPVFELPRSPILSIGELQHLQLVGSRPFAVGNSWGEAVQLNGINTGALFDQFFFSGLAPGVKPTVVNGALVLPNPLLKPMPRNSATGAAVVLTDLQNAPIQQSSKFLLQGGAFNLNSVNPTAWISVLRGVRFPAPAAFNYLDADPTTGTGPDSPPASPPIQSSNAQFLRFAQSAQETYKAEAGNSGGAAQTQLFRQGMRTLTAAQVSALASAITNLIKVRQTGSGPFRSLEEFLGPATTGNPSLLEQAISNAGINSSVSEFSSQFLTQADIMTALAPVLFPRSDTFVIRSYGEAVNPTTAATEGRAWCEAIVQREPDYFDSSTATGDAAEIAPAALKSAINQSFGRRFKIISFRWLTRSDI